MGKMKKWKRKLTFFGNVGAFLGISRNAPLYYKREKLHKFKVETVYGLRVVTIGLLIYILKYSTVRRPDVRRETCDVLHKNLFLEGLKVPIFIRIGTLFHWSKPNKVEEQKLRLYNLGRFNTTKPFFKENSDVHSSLAVTPTKNYVYNNFIASNSWIKFKLNWLGSAEDIQQMFNSYYPKIVFINVTFSRIVNDTEIKDK